jgi:predicted transcriptional regulator
MSTPEFARKVFNLVADSAEIKRRALDFEMAYQARVASDRIRFALRQLESETCADSTREASMQLLDALDRLESVEQRFQAQWRQTLACISNESARQVEKVENRL